MNNQVKFNIIFTIVFLIVLVLAFKIGYNIGDTNRLWWCADEFGEFIKNLPKK